MTGQRGVPAGEPPPPICQQCGHPVDADTIGARVGLCHCQYCQVYACRRCWVDAAGDCPSCAFPFAGVPVAAVAVVGARSAAAAAPAGAAAAGVASAGASSPAIGASAAARDLRAPFGVAVVVVIVAVLALAMGGGFPLTAGADGGSPTPSRGASHGGGLVGGSPTAEATSSTGGAASALPGASDVPIPTGTDDPPETREPRPTPPAEGTPAPTPVTTPDPTPRPTPTPEPTPACLTVPGLVGQSVLAARGTWSAAGFTGLLNPTNGHDNATVLAQSESPGACLPPSSSITVTHTKGRG